MNDVTQSQIAEAAAALDAILKRAHLNHMRALITELGNEPVLRIIYNTHPADPHADLRGEDRRKIASAFLKAGIPANENRASLEGGNTPALFMEVYSPPVDMHWTVACGYVNPWTMYILRPDATYFAQQAQVLIDLLCERYATNEQQAASRPVVV